MKESEQRDRFLVDEMLTHLAVIGTGVKGGKERLSHEPEPRYALEHAIELLSEAAEKTSNAFKTANPAIPWDRLRELRKEVAHPYDVGSARIDIDMLWRFGRDDAPALERRLRRPSFPAP